MIQEQMTRNYFHLKRVPSRGFKRRSFLSTLFGRVVAVALLAANAVLPTPSQAESPAPKSGPVHSQPSAATVKPEVESTPNGSFDSAAAFNRRSTATKNERCYSKKYAAPNGEDAALVGKYFIRLLPAELRALTTWRYDERENALTIYGPQESLKVADDIFRQFDERLFESTLALDRESEFVGVAGVVGRTDSVHSPTFSANYLREKKPEDARPQSRYYDPERNNYVGVAYQAEGAILPPPQDEAPVFGSEELSALEAATVPNDAASAAAQDNALEIVSYRCSPAQMSRVEELTRRQFALNPEIAFRFDPNLGTIVVHTNKKSQRAVAAYFATGKIYPIDSTNPDAQQFDPRLATGAARRLDGIDSNEPNGVRAMRQAVASNGSVAAPFATPGVTGTASDIYKPQYRGADELKSALVQLFGTRFQKLEPAETDAPYSERQIEKYRFVKRPKAGESERRSCVVDFDALRNVVSVEGDSAICSQMLVLIRTMDQPPLQNGNVRRFIPIENGDSRKIRQIFEYGAKTPSEQPISLDSSAPFRLGIELAQVDRSNLFTRFAPLFSDVAGLASGPDVASNGIALASSQQTKSIVKNPILQVAFQEGEAGVFGALGDLGGETNGGALGGFDSQLGNFDGRRGGGPGGVGVVQDFIPTVLDNLDVVIVDNATDAEFERIKQMIEQIEELAKIADPIVEVYPLKHVDGAMLHGVLTKLYQEMFATKQGRVMFYALQNPNALLVVGWGQAFVDMKNLIEVFDQPISDGNGTMRVVRLQYASASEIAASLTETFVRPLTDGTGGLAPRIRAFADVRTNSLVVQASPNDWLEIQKILVELDVNKVGAKLTTRVFSLKNSLADNIRTTIMEAILPAKQGTLDTTAAKFPMLELLSVDESGRKLVESGVMMDVEVTADVYHNQIIVSAPDDCMEFMAKLIEMLDVAPKKAQIRFFQVRHGDATQIMKTLQSLLATTDQNVSTPTLPNAEGEETFVPVRFALDTRTNVIIAAAAPKELAIVDALVVALDVKDTQEREEVVVQLRNIRALVVAEAIDDYLSQKQALETASEVLSNYQLYESQVIVIPESISNSIIVSASPEYMDKILEMIKVFDKDPPQVVIQVLIAEVTLTDQEEFGIEAGLQDSASFNRSLIKTASGTTGATGDPGFNIVGSSGPGQNMQSTVNPTDVAGQVLNSFGMGSANSRLGYGGFVLSASSRSVDVTLRALREKNRLQVLSRPQVTAMDNQQAFILVGQRVPRINGTTTTNYGVQMNTTDTPVGLILLVTPRVTEDGKVVMEIGAEKSSLGNDADAVPIYSQDGEVIKSQSIDTIQTLTAISARDGETVMLGGLLTSTKEKIGRGVPYLSDIPLLGRLFRYDQESEQRKELLIVMTPRIMRGSEDFSEVMRVESEKMTWELEEAMKINGDMGLYDVRTGHGFAPKEPKHIFTDFMHPDLMNELDDVQNKPYTPEQDYAPREKVQENTNPYGRRPRATSAPTDSPLPTRRHSIDGDPILNGETSPALPDAVLPQTDESFELDGAGATNSNVRKTSETRAVASRLSRETGESLSLDGASAANSNARKTSETRAVASRLSRETDESLSLDDASAANSNVRKTPETRVVASRLSRETGESLSLDGASAANSNVRKTPETRVVASQLSLESEADDANRSSFANKTSLQLNAVRNRRSANSNSNRAADEADDETLPKLENVRGRTLAWTLKEEAATTRR